MNQILAACTQAWVPRARAVMALVSDTACLALAIGYSAALLSLAARLAGPAVARLGR